MFITHSKLHNQLDANYEICQYDAVSQIQTCIKNVTQWMNDNKLKLNEDKTEILAIGLKHQTSKLKFGSLNIGEDIAFSPSARNLGVLMDSQLDMA